MQNDAGQPGQYCPSRKRVVVPNTNAQDQTGAKLQIHLLSLSLLNCFQIENFVIALCENICYPQ